MLEHSLCHTGGWVQSLLCTPVGVLLPDAGGSRYLLIDWIAAKKSDDVTAPLPACGYTVLCV